MTASCTCHPATLRRSRTRISMKIYRLKSRVIEGRVQTPVPKVPFIPRANKFSSPTLESHCYAFNSKEKLTWPHMSFSHYFVSPFIGWPCDRHQRCREMGQLPSSSNTDTVKSLQSSVVCVSELGTWRGVSNSIGSRSSWRMS